jgi:uncharacterized membrane protein YdjX (TVP38/TMEM64 family)
MRNIMSVALTVTVLLSFTVCNKYGFDRNKELTHSTLVTKWLVKLRLEGLVQNFVFGRSL